MLNSTYFIDLKHTFGLRIAYEQCIFSVKMVENAFAVENMEWNT